MTILINKERKKFGEDLSFDDFIELLNSLNILLNLKNEKILNALNEYCFKHYCSSNGKINKDTLKKDVIKKIPFIKHNHSSNEGLKERGFDNAFIKQYKRERSKVCIEFWIKKGFTEEYAKEKISEQQSKIGKLNKGKTKIINKEYIESLGLDSKNFFRKRSIWCIEYWLERGFSEKDAKKKISELQTELAKRNLSKTKNERQLYNKKSLVYWTNKGYSEDDAKKIISNSQKTFSLEKCIDKYGDEEGYKKWKERQIKWQESLNKVGFHQLGHSKISQELFNEIIKKYLEDDKDYVFYETKNKEYTLKNSNGFYYRYDFCDLKRRKFIEFNGDIYHANPELYKEIDKPNPFHDKTAKEIWAIDEDKKSIAEKNGFKELVIWEKDYREDKEKIINECIKFLFENE